MSDDIRCPACGEEEDLSGVNHDGLITVTCGSCATVWDRDNERTCPRCGTGDMYPVPVAILEKSRGTQLSIMGTRPEYLCWVCHRDLIDAQRQSGTPIMPDELPA